MPVEKFLEVVEGDQHDGEYHPSGQPPYSVVFSGVSTYSIKTELISLTGPLGRVKASYW